MAGGRGELPDRRRDVGRRIGRRVGGFVRAALPHVGDRADERALAGDRAGVGGAAGRRRAHRRGDAQRARSGRHGARVRGDRRGQRRHRHPRGPPEPCGASPGLRRRRGDRAAARLPRSGARRQRHRAAARRPRGVDGRRPRSRLHAAARLGNTRPSLPASAAAGVLDSLANFAFLLAVRDGDLAVVAVITALYPAATVVLARAFLAERIGPIQLAGLGVAAVAVSLLAVG